MGNNLRGSFEPSEISKWFWEIINRAKGRRDALELCLRQLTKDEVIRFQEEFLLAAAQLVDEPFLDHLEPDTSEDAMQDLAEWVVSQGRQFYVDVWNNPLRISSVNTREGVTYSGVAENVFWERFGTEVPLRDTQ